MTTTTTTEQPSGRIAFICCWPSSPPHPPLVARILKEPAGQLTLMSTLLHCDWVWDILLMTVNGWTAWTDYWALEWRHCITHICPTKTNWHDTTDRQRELREEPSKWLCRLEMDFSQTSSSSNGTSRATDRKSECKGIKLNGRQTDILKSLKRRHICVFKVFQDVCCWSSKIRVIVCSSY